MPNFGSAGPYGASSVSAFGSSSMLACGPSSTPTFRFGPIPSYGQSSNAFVGSSGRTNPSSYGTGHSDFGEYFLHFLLFMQLWMLEFFSRSIKF